MNGERKAGRIRAAALLILALAPVIAGAGLFDDEEARRAITRQQQRMDELRAQVDILGGRLAAVEEALKNQAALQQTQTQPVLELAGQIQALREEVRSLRGQIEVVNNSIDGAAKRQRDMYVDLDTRLKRLEQAATAPASPVGAPAAPGAAVPPSSLGAAAGALSAPTPEETRAYEAAQSQRRIGNYQGAIAAFQAFVAQHPRSSLAPRAQYWIGDSYYNLRDFKNAIASQQKVISAYADSATVPDAMLNIASSQLELGDTAAARKTMDGIVARYPSTDAAEKAKRRLATLK